MCAALMVALVCFGIRYLPTYDIPVVRGPAEATAPAFGLPVPPHSVRTPVKGSPYEGAATTKPVRTKQDVRAAVLGVSAGGVLVIMAVGLGAGWVVSRRLLAALYEVAGAAAKARDGGLAYRITAPFCRARSRVGTGHGLGLALVRSIAVAHRGSASAAANPEGGLTVRASFPAR